MPTKTISTQQAKTPITGTTKLLISLNPCVIFDIEGDVNSTTGNNYYLQLLGTSAPVSGTTIPLWSRQVVETSMPSQVNGFSFVYRPGGLDTSTFTNPAGGTLATTGANTLPVYLAISSTDNVWTSVAASTNATVNFEETYNEFDTPNQVITGDLITGVDSLAVFTDPNTTKRLTEFTVTNNNGATAYLMLFAYSNPALGALPLAQWTLASGATLVAKFGSGLEIQQQLATGVNHYGCYLFGSSTTQYLTATSATGWTMQAFNI